MYKQKLLKDLNIIDQTKHFTETLILIAKASASNKHSTPWFNDAYRRLPYKKIKEPTTNNLNTF